MFELILAILILCLIGGGISFGRECFKFWKKVYEWAFGDRNYEKEIIYITQTIVKFTKIINKYPSKSEGAELIREIGIALRKYRRYLSLERDNK